jgi:hypothetical protein
MKWKYKNKANKAFKLLLFIYLSIPVQMQSSRSISELVTVFSVPF